ncbi:MAG TPA: phosphoribosyltransferase family protein [Acidimicrobiales bacterium]|nr:phosphoribosyltransferase family protein [Acidimicrobiales bacterium]
MTAGYRDRADAGRLLAVAVKGALAELPEVVLALPRGGVPVAAEVAGALGADLDVLLVRKLGVPGHRELAMGAIASGGIRVVNADVVANAGIDPGEAEAVIREEQGELERRARAYRGDRPPPDLAGRRVLLVDDGLATGATMLAAVASARAAGARRVDVAVPVAPRSALDRLAGPADAVVCPLIPDRFYAVGSWYGDFGQVPDGIIRQALGVEDAHEH